MLQSSNTLEMQTTTKLAKKQRSSKIKKVSSKLASVQSSYHASTLSPMIERIRKSVKEIGKETGFHRLTSEEKQELVDIVYTYKRQGHKTSENEVVRIALRYLLEEHKESGKESTLNKVLEALKA